MRAVILSLLLLSVPASAIQSRSITIAQDTDTDTRCFAAYLKQPIPDFEIDEEDAISFDLKNYYAAGDDNVTNSPKCTDVAPTIVAGGNAVTGLALNTTDLDNATYGGTTTTSSAGTGTLTLTFDNSISTSVVDSIGWTVNDSGTPAVDPPMPASAYCVSSVGNDAASGRFPNCWRTLGKVNGFTFSGGDDVYLRASDVFADQSLTIDWGGSASNPVVVGAYYVSSGQPFIGIGGGSRPEINGTYTRSCHAYQNSTCVGGAPFDPTGGVRVPSSYYGGLVDFGASYVTLQDIALHDSAGSAIASTANTWTNLTVDNVDVDFIFALGLNLRNQYVTVKNSTFDQIVLHTVSGKPRGGAYPVGPVGLLIRHQRPAYALIEGNTFTNIAGEGFGCLQSSHCIFRHNTIANVNRPAIYADNNFDSVYEHNIIVGTGYRDDETFQTSGTFNVALGLSVEPYGNAACSGSYNATGNVFRNNLIANVDTGIHISVFSSSTSNNTTCQPQNLGFKVGALFYGNTFVDIEGDLITFSEAAANVDTLELRNNIFADSVATCSWPAGIGTRTNNAFDTTPSDSDCLGTSAQVGNTDMDAGLATATAEDLPAAADFEVGNSSVALNNGVALSTVAVLDDADYPQWAAFSTCSVTAANWEKGLAIDYDCGVRSNPPEIGAKEK